jgi:hypothetical protein
MARGCQPEPSLPEACLVQLDLGPVANDDRERHRSRARASRKKDVLGRSPPGRIRVELCIPARRFLGPEAPVLLLRELIQACQKRLCETCALRDGQLQGFGFQLGKVHGGIVPSGSEAAQARFPIGEEMLRRRRWPTSTGVAQAT